MRIASVGAALDRMVGKIEGDRRLDAVADKVAPVLQKAFPAGPVKDTASGTPFGHPLHPALIAVPIGSWVAAASFDLAGGRSRRSAAQRLIGFGALAALPAAATGISDWLDTAGEQRRVGAAHAMLNSTALSVYGASWLLRRRDHHALGVATALVGASLMSVAGWLGGHLAYALGVGVDTTVFETLPDEFTDVAARDAVSDGALVGAEAGGEPILLVGDHGEVRALADRCTHRGGPLHEGEYRDGCVVCPWHQSSFRVSDGSIARGPAVRPQPVLNTRTDGGRVLVRRTG
jgi:nitrite reductase/ring-hydroxylating ferredoxin subunit/uncharacterized membrane protein